MGTNNIVTDADNKKKTGGLKREGDNKLDTMKNKKAKPSYKENAASASDDSDCYIVQVEKPYDAYPKPKGDDSVRSYECIETDDDDDLANLCKDIWKAKELIQDVTLPSVFKDQLFKSFGTEWRTPFKHLRTSEFRFGCRVVMPMHC